MKKIILSSLVLLVGFVCFGETFPGGKEIVETFLNKGSYIKVVQDANNISYTNKDLISSLAIDENDIEIATNGYNFMTGKNNDSASYNIKKWNITSDENGNIVITKK